jgi:hypothetical protein
MEATPLTSVGPLTTSIKYHQRSGMRCLNFIEVSVHARINQKITKTAIGPKFPYRRQEARQTVKTTKTKNMAIEITYNSITKFAS